MSACPQCGRDGKHTVVCPVGRGLEEFAIVNAIGQVVGHEWLSPRMARSVRDDIVRRAWEREQIEMELLGALRQESE